MEGAATPTASSSLAAPPPSDTPDADAGRGPGSARPWLPQAKSPANGSVFPEDSPARTQSELSHLLDQVVAMSPGGSRDLRQKNASLQEELEQVRLELETTKRRNADLEKDCARLGEFEQEMSLHLDQEDELFARNEAMAAKVEEQNHRSMHLWESQQQAERARMAAESELSAHMHELHSLRTQSAEAEQVHARLQGEHTVARAQLDREHLQQMEELHSKIALQDEDLASARKETLEVTRELEAERTKHETDMQGCDLAVEAATKALQAARDAQSDAESRLAAAETAIEAGAQRERAAAITLASIEKELHDMRPGAISAAELAALQKERAGWLAEKAALETKIAGLEAKLPPEPEPEPLGDPPAAPAKKPSSAGAPNPPAPAFSPPCPPSFWPWLKSLFCRASSRAVDKRTNSLWVVGGRVPASSQTDLSGEVESVRTPPQTAEAAQQTEAPAAPIALPESVPPAEPPSPTASVSSAGTPRRKKGSHIIEGWTPDRGDACCHCPGRPV